MRVQAIDQRIYTYPNITIVCGTPQYAEPNELTLLNPTVIIEILSPSTEAKDRKEKLEYYRTIDTLQAYILIAQDTPYVQYYSRQTPHFWYVHLVDDLSATIDIKAIDITISVQNIYSSITF
jgi:Uma2 family endonuclease